EVGDDAVSLALEAVELCRVRATERHGVAGERLEDGGEIERRSTDRVQDLDRRGLLRRELGELLPQQTQTVVRRTFHSPPCGYRSRDRAIIAARRRCSNPPSPST